MGGHSSNQTKPIQSNPIQSRMVMEPISLSSFSPSLSSSPLSFSFSHREKLRTSLPSSPSSLSSSSPSFSFSHREMLRTSPALSSSSPSLSSSPPPPLSSSHREKLRTSPSLSFSPPSLPISHRDKLRNGFVFLPSPLLSHRNREGLEATQAQLNLVGIPSKKRRQRGMICKAEEERESVGCFAHTSAWTKKGLLSILSAGLVMNTPYLSVVSNGSLGIVHSLAQAQTMGQIRQAAVFLERLAGGSSSKILDKVVTVISGQAMVTPENIEQLKSIIDGEQNNNDWWTTLTDLAGDLWSYPVDLVTKFNPTAITETPGVTKVAVETLAERFAAFELSALVSIGERWLLWIPIVLIPMYWQMSRNRASSEEVIRKETLEVQELTQEALARAEKVRRELERIKLKADLLGAVDAYGVSLQTTNARADESSSKIEQMMQRLIELNPILNSSNTGVSPSNMNPNGSIPLAEALHEIDGNWELIYASQGNGGNPQELLPFPPLIPGIEVNNLQQKVWPGEKSNLQDTKIGSNNMMAKNRAEIRLGGLGVIELSVQGSWERLNESQIGLVSFDTFAVRPLELLGTLIREDLPPLLIEIPKALQITGEWELLYLDDLLRINRGKTGNLFLFRKAD